MSRQTDHTSAVSTASVMRDPPLRIVTQLLAAFDQLDILYCHWKSNEHLLPALTGKTDLDILVGRDHEFALQCALAQYQFKRFAAPALRAYPGIQDYIGLDEGTGRLVHVHLHYELTLGQSHLKGYRLPWEQYLLHSRKCDRYFGIYTAAPSAELVTLLTRAALKQRGRDRLRGLWSSNIWSPDTEREFVWLRGRVSAETAIDVACSLIGEKIRRPFTDLLLVQNHQNFRVFSKVARRMLKQHSTFGRFEAACRAWLRELHWLIDILNRRYLGRPAPLRRVSPRGGAVIVFVGCDGAGKSTLVSTVRGWLAWKLDVIPIYFGSGDGTVSFYRWPLRVAHRLVGHRLKMTNQQSIEPASDRFWRLRQVLRVPWAIALSLERRGKLRKLVRARNRGLIVICDRFPQSSVPDFNDGPLLARWKEHKSPVLRAISRWEAQPYHVAAGYPADLVIKLSVKPEVASARRPDMSIDEIQRRIHVVESLQYAPASCVKTVDSSEPLAEVALKVKQAIWRHL